MSEEKKTGTKFNNTDAIIVIGLFALFAFFSWLSMQRDVSNQNYLASLTPAEREQIRLDALAEKQAKAEVDAESTKQWNTFWNQPIPLWQVTEIFGAMFFVTLYFAMRRMW